MNVIDLLRQIVVLSEYGTTGPNTQPPCISDALSAAQATSLRGSISKLARDALRIAEAPVRQPDGEQVEPLVHYGPSDVKGRIEY